MHKIALCLAQEVLFWLNKIQANSNTHTHTHTHTHAEVHNGVPSQPVPAGLLRRQSGTQQRKMHRLRHVMRCRHVQGRQLLRSRDRGHRAVHSVPGRHLRTRGLFLHSVPDRHVFGSRVVVVCPDIRLLATEPRRQRLPERRRLRQPVSIQANCWSQIPGVYRPE
jgi:hypothetical protein